MVAKLCGICTSMEHPTDMCPILQETEADQPENVGAVGGFQFGKQPYQTRPFDNQQYGRQPFWPGPNEAARNQQSGVPTIRELQQYAIPTKRDCHHSRPQNADPGSSNLPSQTIPNSRGNASVVTLRSGKELSQPTLQQLPRSTEADSELNIDSRSRRETVPLPFPSRTISARKIESAEELLKMFRKVEINIPLLDAIK
ncbi:hypothetical protein CR513_35310, partial [Mucuna pruriens]